jgi:DnaK suppressor protein
MTPLERNARTRLLERRDRLIERLADDALRIRAGGAQRSAGMRSVEEGRARAQRELSGVDRALARLTLGTYGTCERCGRALGTQALRANPETRFCLACSEGPSSDRVERDGSSGPQGR